MLISKNEGFWNLLAKGWRKGALATIILASILSVVWANWTWVSETQPILLQIARIGRVVYAWLVIMTLLGAAQTYLNKPSDKLTYLTKAVFPYYILHQTLIVVFGVWLSGFSLGAGAEFMLLVSLTVVGCVVLYEFVIRRISILKPLFGVFGVAIPWR